MKKLLALMLIFSMMVFVISCGKRPKPITVVPEREEGYPNWVPAPGSTTVPHPDITAGKILEAVGMSEKKASFRATRDTAYNDAIFKLGQQVKTHAEGVIKTVYGDWEELDAIKPGDNLSIALERTEGMIKTIVDVDIQGPKPVQEYQDPDTGRYWVRMLLNSETVEKWLKEKLRAEQELRRLVLDAKASIIQERLDKDIQALREREKEQQNKIKQMMGIE